MSRLSPVPANAAASRSFNTKLSGKKLAKKKVNWLKNIKLMTGLVSEEMREAMKDKSNERLKVHQHGKSYKELTMLHMCQQIQAHPGSILTMKFSRDSRFLASTGEDRVVRVLQVMECDTMTLTLQKQDDPWSPGNHSIRSNWRTGGRRRSSGVTGRAGIDRRG